MIKQSLIAVISFLSILSFYVSANADNPIVPWSKTLDSANGKFVLVLISPKINEQNNYVNRLNEFWKKGGIPHVEIPEARRLLKEQIDREAQIRDTYPISGLYTSGNSPKLLWKIEFYDPESWIVISNDGTHLISGRYTITGIKTENGVPGNPEVKEVVQSSPNVDQVILTFYELGKILRAYKAVDLIQNDDSLQKMSSGDFMWSNEIVLSEEEKSISITQKNGERLLFDFTTGNLSIKQTPTPPDTSRTGTNNVAPVSGEKRAPCGPVAFIICFVASFFRTMNVRGR
jgi:hypothetical protein